MKKLLIKPCTVDELTQAANLHALLAEYGEECAIDGIGKPEAQIDLYDQMEKTGTIHPIGAFMDDELVGLMILIVSVLPHYGKKIAVSESLFVMKHARKSGVGLKLIQAGEKQAGLLGAAGLLVSAPVGGRLAEVLPRIGFCETNRVFFRRLA